MPRIKDFVSLHQSTMHFFTWPSMFWFESMPTLLIDASHQPLGKNIIEGQSHPIFLVFFVQDLFCPHWPFIRDGDLVIVC